MRKALLIVVMLLSVVPVMATTTITAVPEGQFVAPDGNKVQIVSISYSSVAGVDPCYIRAFALDINIDGNSTFANIRDFNTGESNGNPGRDRIGYGIFPSRFRDFVNPANPDPCYALSSPATYNPTTAWNEPETTDHNSGMGWHKMIVEMGTLYAGDANRPPLSGTLFRFDVNGNGQAGTFHLAVKPNALRGGVVNNDGNTITPVSTGTNITFAADCVTPTNEIGQLQAAAVGVWNGQGFASTNGVGVVDCNGLDGKIISYNPTTCVPTSTTINYTYGIQPTVPNLVTPPMTKAQAEAAIVAAHFTVGTETGVFSDTIPVGQVTSQVQTAGTQLPCGTAIAFSYVCRRITCGTCRGDVDGDNWNRTGDITALVVLIDGLPSNRIKNTDCRYVPCADLNADSWIRSGDLTDLVIRIDGLPSNRCKCTGTGTLCPP
jgi:hypothetical protein